MRAISIIYRRELGAYLRSPLGWVIAAVVLLIDGILFQSLAMVGEKLSARVLEQFFWAPAASPSSPRWCCPAGSSPKTDRTTR